MKNKIFFSVTLIILIAIITAFVISSCSMKGDSESESSTKPVFESINLQTDDYITVDGNDFMNKYYLDIKTKYQKNNNKRHDLFVDELNCEIDAFYKKVKTGITQKEYESYEASINSIIGKIESKGRTDSSEKTAMTKEQLVQRIDILLVEEIEQKILQIEYSERKDKTKEERKAPFEALLVEAENLMDDIENGIVSVEDGEKIYNKLTREYYSAQSID